jgi:hypothetical protein
MLYPRNSNPIHQLGVILFGAGFGNANSLPPLIAQVELVEEDVVRVAALIVANSQAFYAFAPAAFGLIRELIVVSDAPAGTAPHVFAAAGLVQLLAIAAFLLGRRSRAA